MLGAFLIANGTTPWIPLLSGGSFCYGEFFTCSDTAFGLVWFGFGVLLVYLTYPIAIYRSRDEDEPLLWNKQVSGISLVLTGTVVAIIGVISMFLFNPFLPCPINQCSPSIFSVNNLGYWISVIFGLILVAVGLELLALNAGEEEKKIMELSIRLDTDLR